MTEKKKRGEMMSDSKSKQLKTLAHQYISSTQNPDLSEFIALVNLEIPELEVSDEEASAIFKLTYRQRKGLAY